MSQGRDLTARALLDRRGALTLVLILAVAAAVRIIGVNFPSRPVVDEFWYVKDGCYYWTGSVERCGLAGLEAPDRDVGIWLRTYGELTPEHPPLAKALIGVSVALVGYRPTAWRVASVVAGIATVALVYLLVLALVGATTPAAVAASLLAIEPIHVVHSRIAMLDVFVGLFAVLAFLFAVLDRRQIERRASGLPSHWGWRAAAGVAAGAAAASKLSGAAVIVGLLGLVAAWEVAARHGGRLTMRGTARTVVSVVILLGVLPGVVYAATYLGRLDGVLIAPPWDPNSWAQAFIERQAAMLEFHAAKPTTGVARSILPMTAPALEYALERTPDGALRTIVLFGNPITWWGGFAAAGVLTARAIAGRTVAGTALVMTGFVVAYAGWLSLALTERSVHLFYAVPLAPFLCVAVAVVLAGTTRSLGSLRARAAGVVAASAVAFLFFLPILIGLPLTDSDRELRSCAARVLWLGSVEECALGGPGSAP